MDPVLRILDAAANRAREALRVMEDSARFAAADAAIARDLKALRHDLRASLDAAGLTRGLLAAHRDAQGDVGASITAPGEHARSSLADVARAAGARAGEALRSLEEHAKLLARPPGEPAASPIQPLRYRLYEVEQRLLAALASGRAGQHRVCVILTESACGPHPWDRVAEQALDAGADALQLREKALPDAELLARARRLVALARGRAAVYVNDRADLALLAGADGVQLGATDLPVAEARRLAGDRLIIGASTHTVAEARAAVAAGADFCGLGRMFDSATKPDAPCAGPPYLRAYLSDPGLARVPHLAIGGIDGANAGLLADAGCRGVAVCRSVCASNEPAEVVRRLVELFPDGSRTPRPDDAADRPARPGRAGPP